jgi:hypothetical protein
LQPALDAGLGLLPSELVSGQKLTADDMEGIDMLMAKLRERARKVISE